MSSNKRPVYKDVLEIIGAFLVAWLFYQALALITGSSQPVVAVVSSSMEHNAKFDEWWQSNEGLYNQFGISNSEFRKFPMPNGLYIGDILFIVASDSYNVGDIIVYHPGAGCFPNLKPGQTIIHRIVKADEVIMTKGDSPRNSVDRCSIDKENIVGKALFVLPLLGYPRIILYAFGI